MIRDFYVTAGTGKVFPKISRDLGFQNTETMLYRRHLPPSTGPGTYEWVGCKIKVGSSENCYGRHLVCDEGRGGCVCGVSVRVLSEFTVVVSVDPVYVYPTPDSPPVTSFSRRSLESSYTYPPMDLNPSLDSSPPASSPTSGPLVHRGVRGSR